MKLKMKMTPKLKMLRNLKFEIKVLAAILLIPVFLVSFPSCKQAGITINVFNWGEYIGDKTNSEFTQKTGIKVNYTTFSTNEELYAKIKSGGVSYDVIIPSDYMLGRMISENLLQKLDFSNIPNYKDINAKYKDTVYDPSNEYTVPYTWGTMGIIYNKKIVKDTVDSWNILWDPKYSGQILMINNSRDAIGIALKKLGFSYNTTDVSQLNAAAAELKKQKPLVQTYVMDEVFDKMEGGDAALAVYYAGDAITMMQENADLAFAVPKEGTNFFIDAMAIPKNAANKKAAEEYINFMSSSQISVENMEATGYSTPSDEAYKLLPDAARNNKIAYPDDSILKKAEIYNNLPQTILKLYDNLWLEVRGS
jgi:spermidine/putrescine transport system substrate-binding protein